MREYYKKNPEVRFAHILIELKTMQRRRNAKSAHKRAFEIMDDVKKSKRPFEELVRLYTDDLPTKEPAATSAFNRG